MLVTQAGKYQKGLVYSIITYAWLHVLNDQSSTRIFEFGIARRHENTLASGIPSDSTRLPHLTHTALSAHPLHTLYS